ncbi:hypothetical protein NVP1161O_171 [Vibrio phage 1.161.O._10N.261.48.C5]|nr:hypothetical protein NVP1161O_171 [Vibrio phage 1.161.O._10N.261.48.C5]
MENKTPVIKLTTEAFEEVLLQTAQYHVDTPYVSEDEPLRRQVKGKDLPRILCFNGTYFVEVNGTALGLEESFNDLQIRRF